MARSGRRQGSVARAGGGILVRLARDARGGAAVMLAMMVIPMLLFVGSAVDVARVYTVKARLQQACDAGVLAGRSVMASNGDVWDSRSAAQANAFFNNNFHVGWMQTKAVTITGQPAGTAFVPDKTAESQVGATATAQVPMAIMKMFGFQPMTLTVTCEARYDTADADIMFVLDTTGSMACLTGDLVDDCNKYAGNAAYQQALNGQTYVVEKTKTASDDNRMAGLRSAVLTFFDTVTKLKKDGGSADPSTNFRFGFVPYNATVNIGKTLNAMHYMKSTASYQTRKVFGDTVQEDSSTYTEQSAKTKTDCNKVAYAYVRTPRTALTFASNGKASQRMVGWMGRSNTGDNTDSTTEKCYQRDDVLTPTWQYFRNQAVDVSGYLTGSAVDNPAQVDSSTSTWAGCVEERVDPSSPGMTSFSPTSPPDDLDPDPNPTSSDDYWSPWWPEVEFFRLGTPETSGDPRRTAWSRGGYYKSQPYWSYDAARTANEMACPLNALRLTATTVAAGASSADKANTRSAIQTYMSFNNGFRAYGTTYHDVGMLWGLRLISPTGMFKDDTKAWTGHNSPNRFIIFLTDGDIETDPVGEGGVYSTFGIEALDGRIGAGATGSSLDGYHSKRFLALCQMAKNRNIKIFTISYAQAKTADMTTCASSGQDYYAKDKAGLDTAFKSIAQQVALLRISK